jgi:hypothetical protein
VKPADAAVNGCLSGDELPQNEQPLSLPEAVYGLTQAVERQCDLLAQIVAQNSDLMAVVLNDEEDDEPERDLAGRPLK